MTSERTIVLQISGITNFQGFEARVIKALHERIKSLSMDYMSGELTVITNQDTEAIIDALKREFPYRNITLLRETRVAPNSQRTLSAPWNMTNFNQNNAIHPVIPPFNFQDMAQASLLVSRDKRVERVEFTQTNTISRRKDITQTNSFKVNFTDRDKQQSTPGFGFGFGYNYHS